MPLQKVPLQISCKPVQVLKGCSKVSHEPSHLQAEQPQVSAFPHRRGVPAFWSLLLPSSGSALTTPRLSCAECSGAGHRTPGEVSPEQNRGAESPPSTCWPCLFDAAQDTFGLLGSAHCQVMLSFSSTNNPKSFSSGLLSIHVLPSLYLCLGPCTWPC